MGNFCRRVAPVNDATARSPALPRRGGSNATQFKVNGGLTFASASNPDIYQSRSYNFSPRFGLAWTPTALKGKTVIRLGTGVFVLPISVRTARLQFNLPGSVLESKGWSILVSAEGLNYETRKPAIFRLRATMQNLCETKTAPGNPH